MECPHQIIPGPHSNPGDSHEKGSYHSSEGLVYDTESAPVCDNLMQWLGSQDLLNQCCKAAREALA